MIFSYIGRFAPSPTGPLHFGSLVAAMGSYLQARINKGLWFVRIEDLDPLRERAGASDAILRALDTFGFTWDGPVTYQSQNTDRYEYHLNSLKLKGAVYACNCTRRQIIKNARKTDSGYVYAGTCRNRDLALTDGHAIRLIIEEPAYLEVMDRVQGRLAQNVLQSVGDFNLKRRDGHYAYQLAVVVDDADQNISEVVRGKDLFNNTPRQNYLQQKLGITPPRYCHLPLARNKHGDKLSKQTFAPALTGERSLEQLFAAWKFLNQAIPDAQNRPESNQEFWVNAMNHWNIERVIK